MTEQKIALNAQRRPNRGRALESTIDDYDHLIQEPWLAEMIDEIRSGNEDLKSELPFRCAHYFRFRDNHRTQKDADPEAFTFQTTVDIDEKPIVADAIKKAQELHNDESSMWHDMLRHIEYSARGKAHIDVLMPIGLTIAETQQQFCKALGVPYDESCITPERFIYVTDKRQEVFRHPEWYKVFEGEELAARQKAFTDRGLTIDGRGTQTSAEGATSNSVVREGYVSNGDDTMSAMGAAPVQATPSALLAFDLCVKEAGLDPQQMDVWGNLNWHNNLMAVLSVGLMKLMPKEQLRAVVKEKLPNYSETEDCQKLIDYFYANYQADMGFMSVTLREINAKAQKAAANVNENDNDNSGNDDDKVMSELTAGWDPPKIPKKLPRLVELEIRNFDSKYHEPLALTATVGHAGLASHFRATYLNNKVLTPASMASVIGGSGSGKDNCTQLFDIQCRNTLEENDKREMEKVKANAEMRDKMRNAKDAPAKYHPKIRLFEAASKTSLLELQTNIGENGMLVGIYSEADGFVSSSTAAWSNISVILRKGFGGEKHRQFYMSESTCNTQVSMNISLLVEGTPRAILERMFSDKNCENGLVQRFIPVLMPKQKRTFRPPKQNFLSADECKERDALLMELYQKDLALGDEILVLETPKTNNAIGQWYDSLEELYNDGLLTEAEADLSHRCGEFMLKAAIPLIVLYGETKEVIDYAIWVGRMAFYNMCRIYGHRVQADINASNELLTANMDGRKTAEPLLSKMPDVFSLQAFKEQRIKDGQSPEVKTLLSRYCKKGKIQRIGRGLYRKCT